MSIPKVHFCNISLVCVGVVRILFSPVAILLFHTERHILANYGYYGLRDDFTKDTILVEKKLSHVFVQNMQQFKMFP